MLIYIRIIDNSPALGATFLLFWCTWTIFLLRDADQVCQSKLGARCRPGFVWLLLTSWYLFIRKMLIRFANRNFVLVADLVWFDCLIQVNRLGSTYFVDHSNCSEALDLKILWFVILCLHSFGRFLYKDVLLFPDWYWLSHRWQSIGVKACWRIGYKATSNSMSRSAA
jgi:hypothetical protein